MSEEVGFNECFQATGNGVMTGDRDGSHLWYLVINWLWSLLCPVISLWCKRWKGSAIYQHLQVNLSRPQRLGAAGAGADYRGTTPPTAVFLSSLVHSHIHTHCYAWILISNQHGCTLWKGSVAFALKLSSSYLLKLIWRVTLSVATSSELYLRGEHKVWRAIGGEITTI